MVTKVGKMNINKEVLKIQGVTSSRYDFDKRELIVGVTPDVDREYIRIMIADVIGRTALQSSFETITLYSPV